MSHIVTIKTQVRDAEAIRAACRRLGIVQPKHGEHLLFAGQKATGWAVPLPGWNYPAVFNTREGSAHYDNYGGAWGEQKQLDRFLQAYAVEKAKLEARKSGKSVTERE